MCPKSAGESDAKPRSLVLECTYPFTRDTELI